MEPPAGPLDFHRFHREELPALLAAGRGALAAPAAQRLGGIAFRLPDGAGSQRSSPSIASTTSDVPTASFTRSPSTMP